jgi:hypothetical protein
MTPVGGKEIKKFIMTMFKLRADIKKMMSISGTHDSDPMLYVDCAKHVLVVDCIISHFPSFT